jgi:presenilin-like A22 family membrane protease
MRLIAWMLVFFIMAQILGIFTGLTILSDINQNPYVEELVITTDAEEPSNALFFIMYILFGAVFMIALIRLLGKVPLVFVLMEFMLIATSSSIVFYAFLRLVLGYDVSTLVAVVMGLAFSGLKQLRPGFKNAAAIFATAGVGVIFGVSLGILPLIIFLVFLSIYDYLSVFMTKHMVELANFVVKKNLAFTVTAKAPPPKKGMKEQRIDLGTGDMIAPVMLEVSTLSISPVATAFVFVGAVVSLGLFLTLVWRSKMVLPALPPIVFGMIISLLIGFLAGFY